MSDRQPEVAVEGSAEKSAGESAESWLQVLRVTGCRAVVTMTTSLLCLPLLALAWGWNPSVVVSGSMEPALSRGDVVMVRAVEATDVGAGAVIAFTDPAHGDRMTTHRAIERHNGNSYVTKGDANPDPDDEIVTPDRLKGAVAAVAPLAGSAWLWWQEGQWGWLALTVALCALVLRGCVERPVVLGQARLGRQGA
ncbi:signal peptidase I [Streptomyces sp. NPDC086554]|uniref:signal peptidase I n=1 Tax=Streptomyces sp. NPDC086554 TaxID=3154864 RepID=UPI003445DD50